MSILKVFDMMAGGVEFNHYFVNKKLAMPELARFICFTFILIVSISLMNLLVSAIQLTIRFYHKLSHRSRGGGRSGQVPFTVANFPLLCCCCSSFFSLCGEGGGAVGEEGRVKKVAVPWMCRFAEETLGVDYPSEKR